MKLDLIPVLVRPGLVVWHTREQYAALLRGVDLEAARAYYAALEDER